MQLYIQTFREILPVGVEILGCKGSTFGVFWGERLAREVRWNVLFLRLA
jgi:hypothetical protein